MQRNAAAHGSPSGIVFRCTARLIAYVLIILSLGTPPPPNTTHSSETPRSADTRVYRAGEYRPETHRYRRKG